MKKMLLVLTLAAVLGTSLLTATAVEAIQATVNWTDAAEPDPANAQTGVRVYRRDGVDANPWVQQGPDLAAGALTLNQTGLALSTRYCYQVEYFNAFGAAARQPALGACGTPDNPLPAGGVTVIFAP